MSLLEDRDESIRGWAVRLLCDRGAPSAEALTRFVSLARSDPSARVRLSLASALQRVPLNARWPLAEALTMSKIDAKDPMLPLMTWYGIEPLVGQDPDRASALAARCTLPLHRNYLARRVVTADASQRTRSALARARAGQRSGPLRHPVRDPGRAPRPQAGTPARGLGRRVRKAADDARPGGGRADTAPGARLGEPKAIKTLRMIMSDRGSPSGQRLRAMTALVERHVPDLTGELYALLDDQAMRGSAIRALAAYNDTATPQRLLSRYASLSESERDDAIATLSARPAWALDLLDAVGNKTIQRRDLNATVARQLLALGDERVRTRLEAVWGTIRQTSNEKVLADHKVQESPGQ